MNIDPNAWYEFHRARVNSRPGQPITTTFPGTEISPRIFDVDARRQVTNGKDVYTFHKTAAERLAQSIYVTRPVCEMAHQMAHFPHFHPGGVHPVFPQGQPGRPRANDGPGHIFFGNRGEGFRPR